ncbi:hypothetical protein MKX01_016651 [Papaver californicum]|nr:hypothetical protein MKX01_016651 [Papaver californicum]
MAGDLLTPPAPTVASESTFSACEILEALICVKDWDDSIYREQAYHDDIAAEFDHLEMIDN